MRKSNQSLIDQHLIDVAPKRFRENQYGAAHFAAWNAPRRGEERMIRSLIVSLAVYADNYHTPSQFEPMDTLAEDNYAGKYWISSLSNTRALLNTCLGRFDAGALDNLIVSMAKNEGFNEGEL